MPRTLLVPLLAALLAAGDHPAESAPAGRPVTLETRLKRGQRFLGSNSVTYTLTTSVQQGDKEESTTQSVERTERFVDEVTRAAAGVLEIERSYLKLFAKARTGDDDRPTVYQSPMQGVKVTLRERNRRREVKTEERGVAIDPIVRTTVGMELDWRDVLPADPVRPGDEWDGDAGALSKRLAGYLECGTRPKMRVRFEKIEKTDDARLAKLYVDWTTEGMRDRHLFTKVSLAGDVYFDLGLHRVVEVDLVGTMIVRGAIIRGGQPKIVRGEGSVLVKTSIKPADLAASAD